MRKFKHLNLSDRIKIEQSLNASNSLKGTAAKLNRNTSSLSREIRNHFIVKDTGAYGRPFNNCLRRNDCKNRNKCMCEDFEEEVCPLLSRSPYVCNGCKKRMRCTLRKHLYVAKYAQDEYELFRTESRSGVDIDEHEIARINGIISPLLHNGHSVHHICVNNEDIIMLSEKTIYNYIDYGLFSALNIDLPRKVRYRPRKKHEDKFKVDKACRIGRTYDDFISFISTHLDTPVVEMDTVEGEKGGKLLLTIHYTDSQLMLAFIRDANTSRSVTEIFHVLLQKLGNEEFKRLFPVILTDNGSEFSNPKAIEFDDEGNRLTHVFYCDPSSPYQKGAIENNHELIRRIVPKGKSFNPHDQEKINLMMNHINSYTRKKLSDKSPFDVFSFLHGSDVIEKLGIVRIHANDIILKPKLLK